MPLIDLARQAVARSREVLKRGSLVKGYSSLDGASAKRAQKYSEAWANQRRFRLAEIRNHWTGKQLTSVQLLELAKTIEYFEVGDSMEHALVVYKYLHPRVQAENIPLDIVVLASQGNHAFVALGQPLNSQPDKDPYPMFFRDWNRDAVICNGWANGAWPARLYPAFWRQKMTEWNDRGKEINGQKPTEPERLDCLEMFKKISAVATPYPRRRHGTSRAPR